MRLVHEPAAGTHVGGEGVDERAREPSADGVAAGRDSADETRPLATTVETADSFLSRARGMMFRRSVPEEFALVFRFDRAATRRVHMLFVAMPLDVLWVQDGVVRRVERLHPWRGYGAERADVLVELPAGGADGVEPGDGVRVESR